MVTYLLGAHQFKIIYHLILNFVNAKGFIIYFEITTNNPLPYCLLVISMCYKSSAFLVNSIDMSFLHFFQLKQKMDFLLKWSKFGTFRCITPHLFCFRRFLKFSNHIWYRWRPLWKYWFTIYQWNIKYQFKKIFYEFKYLY